MFSLCSFPVLFHNVVGEDKQEGSSPSWFNLAEVTVVLMYVKDLLGLRRNPITAKDIGIISPYHKQVGLDRCPLLNG